MKINLQNEFSKRLKTSLVLIILLIGIFFIENIGIYLMVVCLSFFSFSEIYNLRKFKIKLQFYIPISIIIYFLISKSIISNFSDQFLLIFYSLSSLFIIISLFQRSNIHFSIIGFLINSTIFSKISPNKTIEGYIGGIFCSLFLFALIYLYYNLKDLSLILYVIIIIIASFTGDLYVSFFKRKIGIKDLGKLFPGHGGILDRIDSWLFSFPMSFLILYFNFSEL